MRMILVAEVTFGVNHEGSPEGRQLFDVLLVSRRMGPAVNWTGRSPGLLHFGRPTRDRFGAAMPAVRKVAIVRHPRAMFRVRWFLNSAVRAARDLGQDAHAEQQTVSVAEARATPVTPGRSMTRPRGAAATVRGVSGNE